jgi:hypothetical protein
VTLNELEGIDIITYPTFKLYPMGKKGKHLDYEGNLDADELKVWIMNKS